MNAAGTKKTPQDPRRNKKEADGAGSTNFDRLEKSGRLVRKKWFSRCLILRTIRSREGSSGGLRELELARDEGV